MLCGGNRKKIVEHYLCKNYSYEGFDYSDEIVKYAHQYDQNSNIYVQDVTTFESEKKYDVVILLSGLHHVPNYCDTVVSKVTNTLKYGGIFINAEPVYNNFFMKTVCEYI